MSERKNDLKAAAELLHRYQGNELVRFRTVQELVEPVGLRWTGTELEGMALGTVTYGASVAAVRGRSRRQLQDLFRREFPTGRVGVDAETDEPLVIVGELFAAVCFVLLGSDPGWGGLTKAAADRRREEMLARYGREVSRKQTETLD